MVICYKAYDGTMFNTSKECDEYERSSKENIIKKFKETVVKKTLEGSTMTYCKDGSDMFPMSAPDECWYYSLVRISNETDLKIAQMYQDIAFPNAKRKFTEDDIGKELIVTIGESYGEHCFIWGTIDECARKYLKALLMLTDDSVHSDECD